MGSVAQHEYAAFEAKVKRTVFIDNLSPQVTKPIIKAALNQYGKVMEVRLIENYTEPFKVGRCALVEMENFKEASTVVEELTTYPFMISGMPRPVRARLSVPEMFDDRPSKPGRRITLCWLDPSDPSFKAAQKLKDLAQKHYAEERLLKMRQAEEEDKLAKHQKDALKAADQKYEKIENALGDAITNRLAYHYKMKLNDDPAY